MIYQYRYNNKLEDHLNTLKRATEDHLNTLKRATEEHLNTLKGDMHASEIPQFTQQYPEGPPPGSNEYSPKELGTFSSTYSEFWSLSNQSQNGPFLFGCDNSRWAVGDGRLYSENILGAECCKCLQLEIRVEMLESRVRELTDCLDVKEQRAVR
jgi:hypothetical protein